MPSIEDGGDSIMYMWLTTMVSFTTAPEEESARVAVSDELRQQAHPAEALKTVREAVSEVRQIVVAPPAG